MGVGVETVRPTSPDVAAGRAGARIGARLRVIGAFAAIYIIWGSTYLAVKAAVATIPPLTAAGVRFLAAGCLLYAWARARRIPPPTRQHWRTFAIVSAFMFVPPYAAVYWAERTIPSGLAAVLAATLPLWMLIVEACLLRRYRMTWALGVALAVGFVGVVVVSATSTAAPGPVAWLPAAAIVLGELSWAIGSVVATRRPLPASPALAAAGEMLCGGTLLLVVAAATGEFRAVPHPSPGAIVAMLYLIGAGSLVAFTAYTWLLSRCSPVRLSSYTYVNPVVALILGAGLGGEPLTPRTIAGTLLVLASVALILRATRPPTLHAVERDRAERAA